MSGANMTKLALHYIWEFISSNNKPVKIVCTIHDQIDTICHKDYAIEWKDELTRLMEKANLITVLYLN